MKKRFIVVTSIIISAVLLYSYNRWIPKTLSNNQLNVTNHIDSKEQQLWQLFEQHGIHQEEFAQCKQEKLKNKKKIKPVQQVKPAIKSILYHIAQDFNLDPKSIATKTVKNGQCEAWVSGDTMIIDERSFLRLPESSQRFIIAHELQHIIHNDHEDRYTLAELLEKYIEDEHMIDELLAHLYRFQEERADFYAGLKNSFYARAYEQCMQDYFNKFGETDSSEHPKMSERLLLAKNIVAYFDGLAIA